jgi:predicted ATPase
MKILSLKLKNNFFGWDFDEVDFSSNLTLLVGVSGAGKTQILRGIIDLSSIANGRAISGFEWKIKFSTINNSEFIWEGTFDTLDIDRFYSEDEDEREKPSLLYEKIISNDEILIERDKTATKYKGIFTPKLASHQSMIYLLKEENAITELFDAFDKIKYRDHTINDNSFTFSGKSLQILKNKYTKLEDIVSSNENTRIKLYLIYENKLDIFEKIKLKFIEIFQQVDDIKSVPLEMDGIPVKITESFPVIYIKEKFVSKWIREDRVSSGMMRTLILLSEIVLSSEGTIILIDEFENSLGINCIDILTEDLIHENKMLQFIATSHHPYIINNIPYEYWKIVTRRGGHIDIRNASDYNLGKSKQDAFIQLTRILEKQA